MIKFLVSTLFSVVFAGILFIAWLYTDMQKSLDSPVTLQENPTTFVVNAGDNMKIISHKLSQIKVYDHPEFLRLSTRLRELDNRIQAGEYEITQGMTPNDFLTMVTEGRVVQHSITLVEGWTFDQVLNALAAKDDLKKELSGLTQDQIMFKLNRPEEHPEGRFFPDSYFYTVGSSDFDILKRAYEAMETNSQKLWAAREKDLPYKSLYEAMIMASIIEKETGRADERPTIAGVFVRRLQKNIKLQTDPTVIYGIGSTYDGNITRKHLTTDTPYNTYTRKGLPPTPIAMFGAASLEAALHPEKGDTLFFVAKGDGTGSHYFSVTFKEHDAAVKKYQLKR